MPNKTSTPTSTPATTTVVLTPDADAYVSYAAPGTNYGKSPALYVGKSDTTIRRSLIRFDLSDIPSGSALVSANFRAYLVAFPATSPSLYVELKRVDSGWKEGTVTWSNQPSTTTIGKVSGVGISLAYYEWDVTGLVQSWLDGTANRGLALWSYPETTFGWRGFASRESVSPPFPPRLVLTYRP